MKKLFKFLGYTLLLLIMLVLGTMLYVRVNASRQSSKNMEKLGPEAPMLTEAGLLFRDLNKNGRLDIYEDSRQPTEARVEDLLSQMNLEEKAGLMFITMIGIGEEGELQERPILSNPFTLLFPTNSEMVVNRKMNHFNVLQASSAEAMARWNNNIQKLAERMRLGIPVTIATDPRHAFSNNPLTSLMAGGFSQWPEQTGLAATRDTALVRHFGDIARQEYLAVGLRLALHPMADLSTEPRWGRNNGTFGEDAELASKMVYAYIKGFQGDTLGSQSVATMTKHFSGGGPQGDGNDAHFAFGKDQVYPGNNFDYHVIPFEKGAFPAHTAQIMPYYGIPVGQTSEDVGFAFNKEVITGMLREKYGFDGVVCTDWSILTEKKIMGLFELLPPPGWGVETLNPHQRAKKALDAGVDQFGGEYATELIVDLVKDGQITEQRIDTSIRRLLRDKFVLGLFDNPYVDVEQVSKVVGRKDFVEAGLEAQRKSIVLLKNGDYQGHSVLPLPGKPKIYIENMDAEIAGKYGQVVETLEEADFAILRLSTPYQSRPGAGFLESMFHGGDLDFKDEEKARILGILETRPTIVDIYMDRPAVIPEIADKAAGLITNFGAQDDVVLDVIFGAFHPTGKLPFEMPSSMEAVYNQYEDVPYDSQTPLFPFSHGLNYDRP